MPFRTSEISSFLFRVCSILEVLNITTALSQEQCEGRLASANYAHVWIRASPARRPVSGMRWNIFLLNHIGDSNNSPTLFTGFYLKSSLGSAKGARFIPEEKATSIKKYHQTMKVTGLTRSSGSKCGNFASLKGQLWSAEGVALRKPHLSV